MNMESGVTIIIIAMHYFILYITDKKAAYISQICIPFRSLTSHTDIGIIACQTVLIDPAEVVAEYYLLVCALCFY